VTRKKKEGQASSFLFLGRKEIGKPRRKERKAECPERLFIKKEEGKKRGMACWSLLPLGEAVDVQVLEWH